MSEEKLRRNASAMMAISALKFYDVIFPSDNDPWHAAAQTLSTDNESDRVPHLLVIDTRIISLERVVEWLGVESGALVAALNALYVVREALKGSEGNDILVFLEKAQMASRGE